MRCTVETDKPDAFAIERVLQCVAWDGIVSRVFVTTSAILSSPILRGAPQRGSSSRPSKRCAANRLRHVKTVIREVPISSAMAQLFRPSAARRTIAARIASACEILRRRTRASNSPRSLSLRTIFTAAGPVIVASESCCCRESRSAINAYKFQRRDTSNEAGCDWITGANDDDRGYVGTFHRNGRRPADDDDGIDLACGNVPCQLQQPV